MRRLYQKIYLTIVASLVLVVIVAGAIWRLGAENTPAAQAFEMASELISVHAARGRRAARRATDSRRPHRSAAECRCRNIRLCRDSLLPRPVRRCRGRCATSADGCIKP